MNNNTNVILRLKKTIVYIDKILENFPKSEIVLKKRISNTLYDMLELSYDAYYSNNIEIKKNTIRKILTLMKMLDFYIKLSFDKNIISRKNLKTICINLRDINHLYYAWINSNEKSK